MTNGQVNILLSIAQLQIRYILVKIDYDLQLFADSIVGNNGVFLPNNKLVLDKFFFACFLLYSTSPYQKSEPMDVSISR